MEALIGTWAQIEGQPYPGLAFTFNPDGTFNAAYEVMSITSAGTYKTDGERIEMNQTEHTFGLIGLFVGRYKVEGGRLLLNVVPAGSQEVPADLNGAVIYEKIA
ncbi:MAG TPA: hypothetical protein PLG84_02895 [Anaerolineaceae bacterium]|jgi:hypothetical protein|nr:hypothetical protein [Anaerolineaceae bacterium]HOT25220.1 hypothetical protein [Anaerolineaceae bacterium]HQH57774.1 hypothetical protein [Anaerolineaceae bacterium]HQK02719.1 hypothetical protein [Anaerolineaceae bacterium]